MFNRTKALLDGCLEILESLGLLVYYVLSVPMGLFRRFDKLYACFYYIKVLLPRGLMAPFLRTQLDTKSRNYLQAANLLDQISIVLEVTLEDEKSQSLRRVLCDLYCLLFRSYVLAGNIEDAAITVIRAHQHLGIEKLPSTPHFDVKVAHVVKAGVAAGKLLDDGGLATLMVRPDEDPMLLKKSPRTKAGYKPRRVKKTKEGTKIIPFPKP